MPIKRLPEYIVSVLIFTVLVIVALLIALQLPIAYRKNPIEIISVSYPSTVNLCPGDIIPIQFTFEIKGPSVVEAYVVVLDEAGNTMPGTSIHITPKPHPRTVVVRQTNSYVVPDLSPGSYVRTTAFWATNYDNFAEFTEVPFSISPLCKQSNENE